MQEKTASPIERIRSALRGWRNSGSDIHLAPDDVHSLLASERRRYAIEFLANDVAEGEQTDIGTLARYITARELDVTREISREEANSAYVSLYQTHLPRLEEMGVVHWDAQSGGIRRGESVESLAQLVEDTRRACAPARPRADYALVTGKASVAAVGEVKAHV